MRYLLVCLCSLLSFHMAQAQDTPESSAQDVVFILDASGSMWGEVEGEFKIDIAKSVSTDIV